MRLLIPADRVVLDENGAPVTHRSKVNFTGGRVSPSVAGGVATLSVSAGSPAALSPSTQAIFQSSVSLTNATTNLNLGSVYNGVWQSFLDQADTDLANGHLNFAEAGLYHISLYSQITSGTNYPFTNWPRVVLWSYQGVLLSAYGTYSEDAGGTTPARAGLVMNYTGHFDVDDDADFDIGVPAAWSSRTQRNDLYITKII